MGRLRPLILPAIWTLLVGAILVALGVWQLERLAWKEGILARIEARTKAAPIPLPAPKTWASLDPREYEYRRVTLRGTFDNARETPVFRSSETGPGYLILTPLHLVDGGTVLINRGFVPEKLKNVATRPEGLWDGTTTITGLMRGPESRNAFTPADDAVKDIFFTRDPVLIAAHDGLRDAAPFTVDADSSPNAGGWPRGGATETAIPNNHFSYALTWFGLALGLLGVFVAYAWKRLSQDGSARDTDTPSAHRSPV